MPSIKASDLVQIVNINYDSLLASALAIKNNYPSLKDWDMTNPNDGLGVILESYLRAIVKNANFSNLLAQEFSIGSALTKDSVFEKAFLAGYNVTLRTASQCQMHVSTVAGGAYTVEPHELVIKGVNTSGGVVFFENEAQIVIPTGVSSGTILDVPFVEGRTFIQKYTGSETSFETVIVQDTLIDGTIEVRVNGILWTEVFAINSNTLSTDLVYELRHLGRNTYQVVVGDGTNGSLFPKDSKVEVKYRSGQGSEGNILTFYIDTLFSTPTNRLVGVVNRTASDSASGGQDLEDIEKVRTLAPKLSKIQGTIANRWDMDVYVNSYAGVGISKSTEVGMDFFRVYLATQTGNPSGTFMVQLASDITQRLIAGVSVSVVAATKISVNLNIDVIYDLSYNRPDVESAIQTNLQSFLDPFTYSPNQERKLSFGTDLLTSDVYEVITGVPGVIALAITSPVPVSSIVLVKVLDDFILTNENSTFTLNMISSADSSELRADKAEKFFFNNPKNK